MTFWSDVTLKKKLPDLIPTFDPAFIKGASYELGIGGEAYVTPSHEARPPDRVKKTLIDGSSINIPRGQFAFLVTDECVNVPADAVAFISIKAKIKFKGLVNISGFHVDPGYSGKLVFSVFNAGASDVILDYKDRAFLIWFASLDTACENPRSGAGYMGIPSELVNGISDDTLSLSVLDDKLKAVTERVNKAYFLAAAAIFLLGVAKSLGFSLPPLIAVPKPADEATVAPIAPDQCPAEAACVTCPAILVRASL